LAIAALGAIEHRMSDPQFFRPRTPLAVADIVALTGAEAAPGTPLDRKISGVRPLDLAGPSDLTFFDSAKFRDEFLATDAGACITRAELAGDAPKHLAVLISKAPYRAYVTVARALFADDLKPVGLFGGRGIASGASVHPEARLEDGVIADPGAVIGPRAEIGAGTLIGANAVIGADVCVGRDCVIGANSTIQYALIGDRVVIHPGVHIGQDGFGYVPGKGGHIKVPQTGRVIIQDDVEIGSGTAVDRGAHRDTMIGEGTKIDNLVQIAHNVSIGRHCIIVAHTGISGSCTIGDYVVLGGNVGLVDHVTIGDGAQLAARSGVMHDVPAGEVWGGAPAVPIRQFLKQAAVIRRLAEGKPYKENDRTK
jgi:UDP-3-O-[3-hydroxymyristoyl] glucosamine N-acyltransferase